MVTLVVVVDTTCIVVIAATMVVAAATAVGTIAVSVVALGCEHLDHMRVPWEIMPTMAMPI